MFFVKYKEDFFVTWGGAPPNFQRIGTFFKEKAAKYGMRIQEHGFLPYFVDVPKEEISSGKSYHSCMFQAKYRDFFFHVDREKENEVKIVTGEEDVASQTGLVLTGDPREDYPYELWVPRNEITFVTDLDEDVGYIISDPGGGPICYIVDSNKTHLLVKTNQYRADRESRRKYNRKERWEERSDGWFYQWLPKEKVYVYKDHDETFRH